MARVSTNDLNGLADYVASLWLRREREEGLDGKEFFPKVIERWKQGSHERRETTKLLREGVKGRDWIWILGWFGPPGPIHFHLLKHAFPHMTKGDRSFCLQWVWCRSKLQCSKALRLRLIAQVGELRKTARKSLADPVVLYRGACAPSWRRARRRVHAGISWTTDYDVAVKFATGPACMFGAVGCVGKAEVGRSDILAYFTDCTDEEGHHEQECVIHPSSVSLRTYERIQNPKQAESEPLSNVQLTENEARGNREPS